MPDTTTRTAREQLDEAIGEILAAQIRVDALVVPAVLEQVREVAPAARTIIVDIDGPDEYVLTRLLDENGVDIRDQVDEDDELFILVTNLRPRNMTYRRETSDYQLDIPAS